MAFNGRGEDGPLHAAYLLRGAANAFSGFDYKGRKIELHALAGAHYVLSDQSVWQSVPWG